MEESNNTATAVYLDAIGCALGGERQSLEQAQQRQQLLSPVALLRESGFDTHHLCRDDESVLDLALAAASQSLEAYRHADASAIDLLAFATCLPANANVGRADDYARSGDVKFLMDFTASHVQAQLRLDRAQVIGIDQLACTSLLAALRVGASLLRSEGFEHCLCLTADRFPKGAKYEQGYNLISDGAAACVLSRRSGAFRYLGMHHISNGAMAQATDEETAGFFFNYTYDLIQQTLARLRLRLSDVSWIVPQNTNARAWQVLASLLRFDSARVLMPTRERIGHCISGDNLINLRDCDKQGVFASGDIVLLPMAGYGLNWSCVALQKV